MNLNGRLSYEGNVSGKLGAELVADVEANPSGPASQTLVKIRVGDIIYSIPTGGGGGGVTSYSLLTDKPKINNHTIEGEMTSEDLDLQDKIVFPEDGSKYLDGNGEFSTPPSNIVDYSTSEVNTGQKWIDGKDIYQITISNISVPSNNNVSINTPASIEHLLNWFGNAYNADLSNQRPLPFAGGSTSDIRIDYVNRQLRMVTFADWTGYTAYLTIQYTKV